jgi:hypothetical protein
LWGIAAFRYAANKGVSFHGRLLPLVHSFPAVLAPSPFGAYSLSNCLAAHFALPADRNRCRRSFQPACRYIVSSGAAVKRAATRLAAIFRILAASAGYVEVIAAKSELYLEWGAGFLAPRDNNATINSVEIAWKLVI